jgi:hypothetical protein
MIEVLNVFAVHLTLFDFQPVGLATTSRFKVRVTEQQPNKGLTLYLREYQALLVLLDFAGVDQ